MLSYGQGRGGEGGGRLPGLDSGQRLRLDTPLEEVSCATVFELHNQYSGVSRNLAMPTEKERLNLWVYFLYRFFFVCSKSGCDGAQLDTMLLCWIRHCSSTLYAASSDDLIVTLRTITSYRLQH